MRLSAENAGEMLAPASTHQQPLLAKQVGCKLSVFDEKNGEYIGLVISYLNNMLVVTSLYEPNIGVAAKYRIVDMPTGSDTTAKRVVEVGGTCLWTRKQSACVYYIGIKLSQVSDDLKRMLEEHELKRQELFALENKARA